MITRLKYLFTLADDLEVRHPRLKGHKFEDRWLKINPEGLAVVAEGYSWDGCTPKFKVKGLVIGTPDGPTDPDTGKPVTYEASCLHDALYQFMGQHTLSRRDADLIFRDMLIARNFKRARLYYKAVHWMGGLFRAFA
jgi:hypothetical protein